MVQGICGSGLVETGWQSRPTHFLEIESIQSPGWVFLDIQVSSIYLSGNVNDTELENNQVLNRHSLFICELWVRSYIFQFCYEKHHIYLCWSGGFKCAVVSSLWGSGVQRPPRAFDELRPCVHWWAQMTSPPPPSFALFRSSCRWNLLAIGVNHQYA